MNDRLSNSTTGGVWQLGDDRVAHAIALVANIALLPDCVVLVSSSILNLYDYFRVHGDFSNPEETDYLLEWFVASASYDNLFAIDLNVHPRIRSVIALLQGYLRSDFIDWVACRAEFSKDNSTIAVEIELVLVDNESCLDEHRIFDRGHRAFDCSNSGLKVAGADVVLY